MGTYLKAKDELDILLKSCGDNPDDRPIIEEFIPEILALIKKFGESGQSGGSAPFTANAISQTIKKLCLQQTICPITGIDEEWTNVFDWNDGKEWYQNKRELAIFKDSKNGKAYYLDAIIWQGEDDYDSFAGKVEGINSRQYIKSFPFTPKTFRINVIKEKLPEDWVEEPFYENDWYSDEEFKVTGVKIWHKEKYRYRIKDREQLKEVFEYYNEYK